MKRRSFLLLLMASLYAHLAGGELNAGTAAAVSSRQKLYAERIEAELRQDILPYWLEHARDRERGGFFGQLDEGARVDKDALRGALLTSRILWTYSAAYRRYHDAKDLEMAKWAYDDLLAHFWDQQFGGLYWSVRADGVPSDTRKIIYVQAFGIYGLAEYHLASGDKAALDHAVELYQTMERRSHDHVNLGYFEEFSRDWKKSRGRGRESAMGSLGQKSQNVHLHILEAYTNLFRAWPDAGLKKSLVEIVDVLRTRVMDPATHHLRLFLEEDWTPQGDEVSYGHDIEFSWLLVEAAEAIGDPALVETARKDAVQIAAVTLKEGVDNDGGIMAEGDASGVKNTFKEWWPQAEGVVGFLNAFQISGEDKYLNAAFKTWDFIDQRLINHKNGEWFVGVTREGRPVAPTKISFWKCPYHNGRACMEALERLHQLQRNK
jgi:mannobiose 2-epimerase